MGEGTREDERTGQVFDFLKNKSCRRCPWSQFMRCGGALKLDRKVGRILFCEYRGPIQRSLGLLGRVVRLGCLWGGCAFFLMRVGI